MGLILTKHGSHKGCKLHRNVHTMLRKKGWNKIYHNVSHYRLRDSVDDFQLISVPGGFKKKASNMYG
jgi:hypothetical protein